MPVKSKYGKCFTQFAKGKLERKVAKAVAKEFGERVPSSDEIAQLAEELLQAGEIKTLQAKLLAMQSVRAGQKMLERVEHNVKAHKARKKGGFLMGLLAGKSPHENAALQTIEGQAVYGKAIKDSGNNVPATANAAAARMTADILHEVPEGDKSALRGADEAIDRNFIEAMRGEGTPTEMSQRLRDNVRRMVARQVQTLNKLGATIKHDMAWFGRQVWDRDLIIDHFGKGLPNYKRFSRDRGFETGHEIYRLWSKWMKDHLDHEKTFQGKDPDKVLEGAFEGIWSGKHGKAPDPLAKKESSKSALEANALAEKISSGKLFHFKDAASQMEQMRLFGSGSVFDSLQAGIRDLSRTEGLMEHLTADPEAFMKRMGTQVGTMGKQGFDNVAANAFDSPRVQQALGHAQGKFDKVVNPVVDQLERGILMVSAMARLGGIVFAQAGDKALISNNLMRNGVGRAEATRASMRNLFRNTPEEIAVANMWGVGIKGFESETVARHLAGRGFDRRSGFERAGEAFFEMTQANRWNRAQQTVLAHQLSARIADSSREFRSLDKMPDVQRELLDEFGFTNEDIRIIADAASQRYKDVQDGSPGGWHIVPDDIRGTETEKKLYQWMTAQVNDGIMVPGQSTARFMYGDSHRGTFTHLARGIGTQFWKFPITVTQRFLMRELATDTATGVQNIAQFIAMSFVLQALGSELKGIANNKAPGSGWVNKDGSPSVSKFVQTLSRTGGLGIYADVLLREYDKAYSHPLVSLPGPMAGELAELGVNVTNTLRGEGSAKEYWKQMKRNIPFANIPVIKPLFEALIANYITEILDPGAEEKRENRRAEKGQELIIKPSQ